MWGNKRGFQLVLSCWTPVRNLCKPGMQTSRCHGGGTVWSHGHLDVQEGRMSPMSPAHIVTRALERCCHCPGWFSPEFYQGEAKSLFLKPGNSSLVFIPADLGHAGKQQSWGSWSPGCSLLGWSLSSSTAPLSSEEVQCIYMELHRAGKGP